MHVPRISASCSSLDHTIVVELQVLLLLRVLLRQAS
jgi:hypothetical protein